MIRHDCEQGSQEWHELHRGRPTAGGFHRIVTAKKWDYAAGAQTYISELIAGEFIPGYGQDSAMTGPMVNGVYREPEARKYYEFAHDVAVEQVGFCMTDDERFGCSPDGLIGDDGGLEVKSPEAKTHIKWLLADEVPLEHLAQVHGCLLVTGRQWWDFLSYCLPLPPLQKRVYPNRLTEKLGEHLETFWTDYQKQLERVKKLAEVPPPTKTVVVAGAALEMTPGEESYF